MLRNKKGQIGQVLTWVIAGILIVVMLGVSIFLAHAIATNPGKLFAGKISTGKVFAQQSSVDLFAGQSVISFLLTNESSTSRIYENLKSDGNFNSYNGNLASKIFNGLYGKYYAGIYLGVSNSPNTASDNKYFSVPSTVNPGQIWTGPITYGQPSAGYSINLTKGKYFDVILAGWGK